MKRSSRQWNRPPRASRRDRRRLSLLGLCPRKSLIEQLEARCLLDANLAITLMNPNVAPGDQLVVSWRIDKAVLDTNSGGAIEASEASAATLTIDAVGLLNSQVTVVPSLGQNAFVDDNGDLTGLAELPVPVTASDATEYSVWGTATIAAPPQAGANIAGQLQPAAATGTSITITSKAPSSVEVDSSKEPTGPGALKQFKDHNPGKDVTWLQQYADSLDSTDVTKGSAVESFLVNAIASRADAIYNYSQPGANGPSPLSSIINDAFDGQVISYGPEGTVGWSASVPTVVLVHGASENTQAEWDNLAQ